MKERLTLGIGLVLLAAAAAAGWYWFAHGARAARLAESDDPAERLQALRELRGKSNDLALGVFDRLARDEDPDVAEEAIRALGDHGGEAAAETLKDLLVSAAAGRTRGQAAATLGLLEGTAPRLLGERLRSDGRIGDPDADARIGAAKGLARLKDLAGLKYLVAALEDPDARVRAVAVVAIQQLTGVRFLFEPRADEATRTAQLDTIRRRLADAARARSAPPPRPPSH